MGEYVPRKRLMISWLLKELLSENWIERRTEKIFKLPTAYTLNNFGKKRSFVVLRVIGSPAGLLNIKAKLSKTGSTSSLAYSQLG